MQAEARDVFVGIALAETGALLRPLLEPRRDELSPQMQYIVGELVDEADDTLAGCAGRFVLNHVIEAQVAAWQVEHPIAIAPIMGTPAFELGADSYTINGEQVNMVESGSFCTYVNQLGLPAAAVPITKSADGLPIGVQVIGRRDHELQVLEVAKKLEAAFGGWMAPEGLGRGGRASAAERPQRSRSQVDVGAVMAEVSIRRRLSLAPSRAPGAGHCCVLVQCVDWPG